MNGEMSGYDIPSVPAKRHIGRKLGCAAALAICALSVIMAIDLGRTMTRGRTAEVPPEHRQARYLLFPKSPDAGIARAIIVNGTELTGTDDIGYYDGEIEKHVARERLSLRPPPSPEELAQHIAALNAEIARWGKETDLKRIDFSLNGNRARLTEYLKNGKISRCTYEIRADGTPAAVTIRHGL